MELQRVLPEIVVGDITLIVDVAFAEVRHKEFCACRASFNEMEREGNGYVIHIEPELQGLSVTPHPYYSKHIIGQMVDLDPEGICIKYGLEKDSLPKDDSDLRCDPRLIEERLQGILPKIDIAGRKYHIDIRVGELRDSTEPHSRIQLRTLGINDAGNYIFLYDHERHNVVHADLDKIEKEPENTVLVELPHDLWLDPIGAARKEGMCELSLLGSFPLQHELRARICPLAETDVPIYIAKNLERKNKDFEDDDPRSERVRKKGRRI
jgi:hypothetical protein